MADKGPSRTSLEGRSQSLEIGSTTDSDRKVRLRVSAVIVVMLMVNVRIRADDYVPEAHRRSPN